MTDEPDALDPAGIALKSNQGPFIPHHLRQVGRLSAGRGAGIEDVWSGVRSSQ